MSVAPATGQYTQGYSSQFSQNPGIPTDRYNSLFGQHPGSRPEFNTQYGVGPGLTAQPVHQQQRPRYWHVKTTLCIVGLGCVIPTVIIAVVLTLVFTLDYSSDYDY